MCSKQALHSHTYFFTGSSSPPYCSLPSLVPPTPQLGLDLAPRTLLILLFFPPHLSPSNPPPAQLSLVPSQLSPLPLPPLPPPPAPSPPCAHICLHAGTTAGQDLNLSMDRLMSSRNFTNKLWNAGKFILFNLEQLDDEEWSGLAQADFGSPGALGQLPLAERWVVSALHQVGQPEQTLKFIRNVSIPHRTDILSVPLLQVLSSFSNHPDSLPLQHTYCSMRESLYTTRAGLVQDSACVLCKKHLCFFCAGGRSKLSCA